MEKLEYKLDSLQVAEISKEVLSNIAIVEVAETTKHKLGLFRCKSRRDFAEVVFLKISKLVNTTKTNAYLVDTERENLVRFGAQVENVVINPSWVVFGSYTKSVCFNEVFSVHVLGRKNTISKIVICGFNRVALNREIYYTLQFFKSCVNVTFYANPISCYIWPVFRLQPKNYSFGLEMPANLIFNRKLSLS
jgi:hypothetical protein